MKELLDKKIREQVHRLKEEVATMDTHTANGTDCAAMEHVLHFAQVRLDTLKKLVANRAEAK